jgi:hypothetical protein
LRSWRRQAAPTCPKTSGLLEGVGHVAVGGVCVGSSDTSTASVKTPHRRPLRLQTIVLRSHGPECCLLCLAWHRGQCVARSSASTSPLPPAAHANATPAQDLRHTRTLSLAHKTRGAACFTAHWHTHRGAIAGVHAPAWRRVCPCVPACLSVCLSHGAQQTCANTPVIVPRTHAHTRDAPRRAARHRETQGEACCWEQGRVAPHCCGRAGPARWRQHQHKAVVFSHESKGQARHTTAVSCSCAVRSSHTKRTTR